MGSSGQVAMATKQESSPVCMSCMSMRRARLTLSAAGMAGLAVIGILFISPIHIPKLHKRGMIACGIVGAAVFAAVLALGARLDIA